MRDYKIIIPRKVDMPLCQKLTKLQKEIWALEDIDVLPSWKLLTTPKTGNTLIIAFKAKKPVALAVFIIALDEKTKQYLYLDMIGVLPKHEGHGLAFKMLKMAQVIAKKRGCNSIRWTFDPLRANNANLYLKKLGATVREYYEDYYSNLSGINQGIPIDRFWAELTVTSKSGLQYIPETTISITDYPRWKTITKKNPSSIAIEIPDSVVKIKREDVKKAVQIRLQTRKIFQNLFSRKYALRGFFRKNGRNFYIAVRGNV